MKLRRVARPGAKLTGGMMLFHVSGVFHKFLDERRSLRSCGPPALPVGLPNPPGTRLHPRVLNPKEKLASAYKVSYCTKLS